MHQKHLLRFIKSKLRKEPHEVVIFRDGKYLTLAEVFESLSLTGCGFYFWSQLTCPNSDRVPCFVSQTNWQWSEVCFFHCSVHSRQEQLL